MPIDDPGEAGGFPLLQAMDDLASNYWHLLLVALAMVLIWRIGAKVVGERPLYEYFPRLSAALDILVLPLSYVVGGTLLRVASEALGLSTLDEPLRWLTALFAYLAAGWAVARLIQVLLEVRAEAQQGERVPRLVTGLVYALLMLVGFGFFMQQQGHSLSGVWVSTGVAAAVLGLALQKTLGDLFSGIALSLEQPFRIGDWLELSDGRVGEVVDMNWRATRLRGWDNTTLVVPNSGMAAERFKNLHGADHLYAPWYFVRIAADVDPRYATELLLQAALHCDSVLKLPAPVVRLANAETLPYSYMVWVHLRNYPSMFRAREELFREIHRLLRRSGIEVAPEVQELRTRRAQVSNAEPPTLELALKSMEFGADLTAEELARLVERSEYRTFDAGAVLLAEGAVSDAFYVIAGGLVESAVVLADGSRKALDSFGPGSYFGLAAMLALEPSVEEFRAKSDVTLIRIDLDCVRGIVNDRTELKEVLIDLIKARMDMVEATRAQSRRGPRRLSLHDIRLRIERRLFHDRP